MHDLLGSCKTPHSRNKLEWLQRPLGHRPRLSVAGWLVDRGALSDRKLLAMAQPSSTPSGTGPRRHRPESPDRYGVPRLTAQHASRPRLTAMLARAPETPLVLLSAPAGTGKTSLVAEWLRGSVEHEPVAWVTVEASDETFWPDVARCLEQVGVTAPARAFPDGSTSVARQILLSLAAAIAGLPRRVTLVVDGYELVDPGVARDLDFLLRHSGHRLRIVLMTRVDPALPLHRYRLDETLTELRIADLAFTDDEAAQLLTKSGVSLAPGSVRTLNDRTGGWAVGLRFAARVLATREDPDRAVAGVTDDNRNIAEYLVGEVLNSHTPEIRQVLLSTSVPDTLQPGLTEELTGRPGAPTLTLLTRSNAFIEPVPEHPGSYRYPPFFRDILRAQLAFESPEQMKALQRRAAEWFAREGLVSESVSHFAAVEAWEDAAAAIVDQLAIGELLLGGVESPLARRMAALPAELIDPAACLVRAVLALTAGDRALFGEQLDLAMACREVQPPNRHDRALTLTIEVLQVLRSRYVGNLSETLALVERAQRTLTARMNRVRVEQHPELSALVLASMGSAEAGSGRLTQAHDAFTAAARAAANPGAEAVLIECLGQMAVLDCLQGQISDAETLARQATDLADGLGIPTPDRPPAAPAALAWVGALREDLRTASEQIANVQGAEPLFDDPVADTLCTVAKSRIHAVRGDIAGALEIVCEAAADADGHAPWMVDRLRIEKGRLRVANGEPELALLELEDVRTTGSEAEIALVTSQVALTRGANAAEALAPALQRDAPLVTQVEGWLVEAARQIRGGSATAAHTAVDRALRLATNERLRLPFRQAPPDVRRLLNSDLHFQAANPWLAGEHHRVPAGQLHLLPSPVERTGPQAPPKPMVEKLTERELEVLRCVAELLTTEEIASTLFISVNTVRTHVRSILRKLEVSRRNAAVRRARDLDLLPFPSVPFIPGGGQGTPYRQE